MTTRRLDQFTGAGYDKGRPPSAQILWLLVSGLVVRRWWCPMALRLTILKAFGARLGRGVIIRTDVKIHWPWKLVVGDHSWIGEEAWILNLEPVTIGSQVCISQQALLCTGSHDRSSVTFEFDNAPIEISDGAWVATRATILRGVTVGEDAVVGAGAVIAKDVPAGCLVRAPRSSQLSSDETPGA